MAKKKSFIIETVDAMLVALATLSGAIAQDKAGLKGKEKTAKETATAIVKAMVTDWTQGLAMISAHLSGFNGGKTAKQSFKRSLKRASIAVLKTQCIDFRRDAAFLVAYDATKAGRLDSLISDLLEYVHPDDSEALEASIRDSVDKVQSAIKAQEERARRAKEAQELAEMEACRKDAARLLARIGVKDGDVESVAAVLKAQRESNTK